MKLSEDHWQSAMIKKQHMIKKIRLSIHYVVTPSILLPFQLVFYLILLISSFNPSILPPPLAASSILNFLLSHAHPPPSVLSSLPCLIFAPPLL